MVKSICSVAPGMADGYKYDLTQQTIEYQQNDTVNLGAGTVTNSAVDNNNDLRVAGTGPCSTAALRQSFNNMNQTTRGTFNHR